MALRVLLADESTTIKKVMQLALQDFAVEVKAVHVGLDVLEVARQFQPDIIFADVLLQKKNGYEVCAELKRDPQLKAIPVVLMWSSFMDLDESLARNANADRRLEKPFDIENLRQVLLDLVPKTHTQRLAHFLKFPGTFSEPPKGGAPNTNPAAANNPATANAETRPAWNMENFDDIHDFAAPAEESPPLKVAAQKPSFETEPKIGNDEDEDEEFSTFRIQASAPRATAPAAEPTAEDSDEPWSHQDLSNYKIDLPPVTSTSEEHGIEFELPDETDLGASRPHFGSPQPAEFTLETNTEASSSHLPADPAANDLLLHPNEIDDAPVEFGNPFGSDLSLEEERTYPTMPTAANLPMTPPGLNADQLESVIRAQSKEIIESVVRRIVPDLATEIIREELRRLLEDTALPREPRR